MIKKIGRMYPMGGTYNHLYFRLICISGTWMALCLVIFVILITSWFCWIAKVINTFKVFKEYGMGLKFALELP